MPINTTAKSELYDQSASLYVLSCLMRNPLLFQEEKYAFVKTDFFMPLQQMVFCAIYNMAQSGAQHITPQDVDTYLKSYGSQYEYFKANKGFEFVRQCYDTTEGSDIRNQFDFYYNTVKKFSVLRDLESLGINTSCFYDPSDILNQDKALEKFNKLSVKSILNYIRDGIVQVENKHVGKDEGYAAPISKNIRELVADYKKHPDVGLPVVGEYLNYATRGARLGKMYIYSAPSGEGKTRFMISNACSLSIPHLNEDGKMVVRGNRDGSDYRKVVYVATEQELEEIQTMVLAYVSDVSEKSILSGKYTDEEWSRIEKAFAILDKFGSNLIIDCIPDPSIAMLRARFTKYIVQDQIEYLFYDYIFSSPGLINEFSDSGIREDVVLMMLSNSLKEIAMTYHIFMMSATQLNDGWSKKIVGFRDQNCIRGSKAIADKEDVGLIGIKLRQEEFQEIEAIWNEIKIAKHYPDSYKPNIVIDVYKNRRGDLNFVKIFRHFDYSTCQAIDLFCTDATYKIVENIGVVHYDEHELDYLALKTMNVAKEESANA